MAGSREGVTKSPGYGGGNTVMAPVSSAMRPGSVYRAIERAWQHLFGKKRSSWYTDDEARRDAEARKRVAEHDKRFYESGK